MKNGFGNQGRTGQCGVYSLIHALLYCGIPTNIEKTRKQANFKGFNFTEFKKHKWNPKKVYENWGTSEKGILSAIKKNKLEFAKFEDDDEVSFIDFVDESLGNNNPLVILNQNYGHWVVVSGKYGKKYVVVNSADERVFITLSGNQLVSYCWNDPQKVEDVAYYAIAVVSKINPTNLFSSKRIISKLIKNKDLRIWWGFYLENFNYYYEFDSPRIKRKFYLKELLKENKNLIVKDLSEDYDKNYVRTTIDEMIVVSEAYGFITRDKNQDEIYANLVEIVEYCLLGE